MKRDKAIIAAGLAALAGVSLSLMAAPKKNVVDEVAWVSREAKRS